jgi:hypothetical protein
MQVWKKTRKDDAKNPGFSPLNPVKNEKSGHRLPVLPPLTGPRTVISGPKPLRASPEPLKKAAGCAPLVICSTAVHHYFIIGSNNSFHLSYPIPNK